MFALLKENRVSELESLPFWETGSDTDRASPLQDVSDCINDDFSLDDAT